MQIEPIATITTPFQEKFAIPRQAQIVEQACGDIQLLGECRSPESLHGLTSHSHYWLIWGFHHHTDKKVSLTARPPRLGGNKKMGVFSTRSPFRPNHLGLSLVRLVAVDDENYTIRVAGVDMLSGSPIYDIKPYVSYADCQPNAHSDWAAKEPVPRFTVVFSAEALAAINASDEAHSKNLQSLIDALLAYDARPAYKDNAFDDKMYATTLYNFDVAWRIDVKANILNVISVRQLHNE